MPQPGILLLYSRITSPSLPDPLFNDWYTNHHVPDVLAAGMADLALRYRSTDPNAHFPYLTVYRVTDLAWLADPHNREKIPMSHEMLPEPKEIMEMIEIDQKGFVKIQEFEGPRGAEGRGGAITAVMLEPGEGGEEELEEWYRKQHLDMLSTLPNYRRSTRYKTADDSKPRYLAIHELDSPEVDDRLIKIATETEWSKKVLGSAQIFEPGTWEFIAEKGAVGEKL